MRILGFSKKWDKLNNKEFTTFRFPRKDKDWHVGEQVQIIYKPRRKGGGEFLGIAEIVGKVKRSTGKYGDQTGEPLVTDAEAREDGFSGYKNEYELFIRPLFHMWEFLFDNYGAKRLLNEPMNKLTLRWVKGA